MALALQLRTAILTDLDAGDAGSASIVPYLAVQLATAAVALAAACMRPRPLHAGSSQQYEGLDDTAGAPRHRVSPEAAANFFSTVTFWWLTPLRVLGYRKPLEMEDLWELDAEEAIGSLAAKFEREWAIERRRASPSLPWALARAFGRPFVFAGFLKLLQDMLAFSQPWLLKQLLVFIASFATSGSGSDGVAEPEPLYWGYIIAVSMFLTAIAQTLLLHQYFHRCFMTGMRIRSAVVTTVYRKALHLSNDARQKSTVGEIVNHMSIDAQKLMDLMAYLHILWSGPLQIARTTGVAR